MRQLRGLKWAAPCDRPSCIPASRPRGVKAEGLRYERALARHLSSWTHGQWLEFEDSIGHGYCQPDLIHGPASPAVIEVKLSWLPEASFQLSQYLEIVGAALQCNPIGIVACRYLRPGIPDPVVGDLLTALMVARQRLAVWHCIDPTFAALRAA